MRPERYFFILELLNSREDEDVYYGAEFTRDGVTERVYAIAEDGSFITEVLEDNTK